ncbi:heme ABC transporter ATP-binding protein [Solimonas soli]|uniref:heme ABC transporter ATP-binding protein n=1 Tax=Solimonas soli TaxID=413479 RepID=UPI0004B33AA0|nr:heme ABC transporter ATP-binding protein [Solimonas soli]
MSLRTLEASYAARGRELLAATSVDFAPGRLHAIVGPNGAGKSTLLRLLAGEWRPSRGSVALDGRDLREWAPAALARRRALLPQQHSLSFPFTAAEVVALGRLHTRRHKAEVERAIVAEALASCGAAQLAGRLYPQLSGGERARVQLARVLAQIRDEADGARWLLLDEPTAHLDLAFQHACLRLAREWSRCGVGVIAVLHDPNLVLAYADDVLVLDAGRAVAVGAPRDVLDAALMRQVFGLAARRIELADGTHWLAVGADG